MRVVSVGDLVLDYYYKNGKLLGVNGGMTSHNIIANISKFKIETAVYGTCGNDIQGDIAIKSLSDLGINTDNIIKLDNVKTRCFHVSYTDDNDGMTFTSKKRCPFCNEKNWYDESKIDVDSILNNIKYDDLLVFDNLNIQNQKIIDKTKNRKVLDLGQYFELEKMTDKELVERIYEKFDLINLNERVEKYLLKRFKFKCLNDIYNFLGVRLLIVTRGKIGADFIHNNNFISLKLENASNEVDPTGAGDSFFSVFVTQYVLSNYVIDNDFINNTFKKATKLTSKVVRKMGARGHLNNLYKIKRINNECTSDNFDLSIRKQIKRCNININNLETRVINAIKSNAYDSLEKIDFNQLNNSLFIGTGGSFAGAYFSSKLINEIYAINTSCMLPRDVFYKNNEKIEKIFMFSYSGTTNDIIEGTKKIDNNKKIIITKGEKQKIFEKTKVLKSNIFTYRTNSNKGKEKGFLSFEGTLAPASMFLKLYFKNKKYMDSCENFIRDRMSYWNNYFNDYFNDNKGLLKNILKKGNTFNIFTGDNTKSASIDLESKIIESGIFNCLIHEKKNFSHGRFINYEHLSDKINIYFKQKNVSEYETKLLKYLENDNNIIIESQYDNILCEFDLLVASQYLIYHISNFLNIDISKPTYSEDAMKIYFYKGEL